MADLNPRIASVKIGIRELRTVHIYPLSVGQQTQTVELITVLINSMAEQKLDGLTDIQLAEFFGGTISENIRTILEFITDPQDEVSLDEIDNTQLVEIIDVIVKVNFGEISKKLKTIWDQIQDQFLSPKSSSK